MRLIDADALIDLLDDEFRHDMAFTAMNLYSMVNSATTIEARPTGKWIPNCEAYYDGLRCSVCGELLPCSDEYHYDANYCPHCGAKMEVNNNG